LNELDRQEPATSTEGPAAASRPGWGVLLGVAILHFVISVKVAHSGPRRVPIAGDPMGLWVGLGFLLWGIACVLSPWMQHTSVLFRFLDARGSAMVIGLAFLAMAIWLLATWGGLIG
jgi:hypothetical protein